MFAIYKREISSYFKSPIGWIVISLFFLVGSVLFTINMINAQSVNFTDELSMLQVVLIVIIPLITMRLFSEEKNKNTEVIMYTAPVSLLSVVIGKYLAAMTLILVMLSTTLIHLALIGLFGGLIGIEIIGAYISFVFLSAVFTAVGILCSSITENQIVAAIINFVVILVFLLISVIATTVESVFVGVVNAVNVIGISSDAITAAGDFVSKAINWFDVYSRIGVFNQGLFSISPLLFCLSLSSIFVFFTYRVLEKRRWTQS